MHHSTPLLDRQLVHASGKRDGAGDGAGDGNERCEGQGEATASTTPATTAAIPVAKSSIPGGVVLLTDERNVEDESGAATAALGAATAPSGAAAKRSRLTAFALLLSAVALAAGAGVGAWGIQTWRQKLAADEAAAQDTGPSTRRAALPTGDADRHPASDGDAVEVEVSSPDHTTVTRVGTVDVVDIGIRADDLRAELERQRTIGARSQQRLLLMVTAGDCSPCRGVDRSLAFPTMQAALMNARLVRVDRLVFETELQRLHIPTRFFPAFVLLGPDYRPVDAIHGGEWDEDVARNIAPVLGAFVGGIYDHRRDGDWAPSSSTIKL